MTFSLSEIQIACVILMGFLTLIFAFVVPLYTKNVKIFVVSKNLLVLALSIATLHFLVQYILHKNSVPPETTRTTINIIFGFPVSYLFTMALMYLVRRGKIKRTEWAFQPLIYIIALLVFAVSLYLKIPTAEVLPKLSFLYAVALLHCSSMQIRGFFDIKERQMVGDHSYDVLRKWTQWSLFLMPGIGLGFPFVIFSSSVTVRAIYGIATMAVAFICVLGIMGYILSYNVMAGFIEKRNTESADQHDDFVGETQNQDVTADKENKENAIPAEEHQLVCNQTECNESSDNAESVEIEQTEQLDTDDESDELYDDNLSEDYLHDTDEESVMPDNNLCDIDTDSDDDKEDPSPINITIDEVRLKRIQCATQKYIEERLFTKQGVTLKGAAKDMHVPVNLLKNWLRTTEYQKFNNWLIAQRVEYAKQLLSEDPTLTNDIVALRCGFCDRQYFQTVFAKYVGVTPFKWVKGHGANKIKNENDI